MKFVSLDSPFMSQKLGERHAKFKVVDKASIGLSIMASIHDTGFLNYENFANISLDPGLIMSSTPTVIHWTNTTWLPLPDDESTSAMTAKSGTEWTLYEKWFTLAGFTDVYVFRIIFTLAIDGEAFELITGPSEGREP